MWDNIVLSGVQFVSDSKGRKVAALIDLKEHPSRWPDFWDGLAPPDEAGSRPENVKQLERGRLRE